MGFTDSQYDDEPGLRPAPRASAVPAGEIRLPLTTPYGAPTDLSTAAAIVPPDTSGLIDTTEKLLRFHQETCNHARSIMGAKNHDYTAGSGDPYANFRIAETLGVHPIKGIMLRMQDKMKRLQTFIERGTLQVQDEGVENIFDDLINYSILAKGLTREVIHK